MNYITLYNEASSGDKFAFEILELYAQKHPDNLEANYYLALCHINGYGTQKDFDKAISILKVGADKKHLISMSSLGFCYRYKPNATANDIQFASKYNYEAFCQSANAPDAPLNQQEELNRSFPNNAHVLSNLGAMLTKNGPYQDTYRAKECFEKSAAIGFAMAKYNLACLYVDNYKNITRDVAKAAKLLLEAIKSNEERTKNEFALPKLIKLAETETQALAYLGMYYEEAGPDQNFQKAFELYERGAKAGCAVAMTRLGMMYRDGRHVAVCLTIAAKHFHKAILKKSTNPDGSQLAFEQVEAQIKAGTEDKTFHNVYAYCHAKGVGVPIDLKKAVELYEANIKRGAIASALDLAWVYLNDLPTKENFDKISETLLVFLRKDFSDQQDQKIKKMIFVFFVEIKRTYEVGLCYFFGLGTAQDYKIAATHLALSTDARAHYLLGMMHEQGLGETPRCLDKATLEYQKALNKGLAKQNEICEEALTALIRLAESSSPNANAARALGEYYRDRDPAKAAHYFHIQSNALYGKITEDNLTGDALAYKIAAIRQSNTDMLNADAASLRKQQLAITGNDPAALLTPPPQVVQMKTLIDQIDLIARSRDMTFPSSALSPQRDPGADVTRVKSELVQTLQTNPSAEATRLKSALTHRALLNNAINTLKDNLRRWHAEITKTKWQIKGKLWGWNDGMPTHIAKIKACCERGLIATNYDELGNLTAEIHDIIKKCKAKKGARRHATTEAFYNQVERDFTSIRYNAPVTQSVATTSHAHVQQALAHSQFVLMPLAATPEATLAAAESTPAIVTAVAALPPSVPAAPKLQPPVPVTQPLNPSATISEEDSVLTMISNFISRPAPKASMFISNVRSTEMDLLKPPVTVPATQPPAPVAPAAVAKPKAAPPAYVKKAAAPKAPTLFLPPVAQAPLESQPLTPPPAPVAKQAVFDS